MTSNPLFSVLIANYNNGCYLREAVDSIKGQSYTNWEIILIDDASTDNSKELYTLYANDSRIKIYYNEENKGCGFTKRRCVEMATGELCGFLDPDDTLTADALQVMVDVHLNRPAVLVCSRHSVCDEKLIKQWESEIRDKTKLNYLTERFHTVEVFATFKRKEYLSTVGLNPDYKRAVDQYLYYLLEEQGEMIFIDDLLYNYRLNINSLSIGHYKALFWHVKAIEEACIRRGLSAEEVVGAMFERVIKKHEEKYQKAINSDYYKFGYKVLAPWSKLKKRIKKWLNH